MDLHQVCTDCGETKPLEAFPPAPTNRNGRRGRCTVCTREWRRRRREGDESERGQARARSAAWNAAQRRLRELHPDDFRRLYGEERAARDNGDGDVDDG